MTNNLGGFDVRGLLALIAIIGTFALGIATLFVHGTAEVPQWAAGIAGAVIGFYFGSRTQEVQYQQDQEKRNEG